MKEKRIWPIRECKTCKKKFHPWNNVQRYCKDPCVGKRKLTLAEINANWVARTEEDRKKQFRNSRKNFHMNQTRII